jgi:hypothetical protein
VQCTITYAPVSLKCAALRSRWPPSGGGRVRRSRRGLGTGRGKSLSSTRNLPCLQQIVGRVSSPSHNLAQQLGHTAALAPTLCASKSSAGGVNACKLGPRCVFACRRRRRPAELPWPHTCRCLPAMLSSKRRCRSATSGAHNSGGWSNWGYGINGSKESSTWGERRTLGFRRES